MQKTDNSLHLDYESWNSRQQMQVIKEVINR